MGLNVSHSGRGEYAGFFFVLLVEGRAGVGIGDFPAPESWSKESVSLGAGSTGMMRVDSEGIRSSEVLSKLDLY